MKESALIKLMGTTVLVLLDMMGPGVKQVKNNVPFCLIFIRTASEINECESNPCLNGGDCTDQVNGYNCSCPAEYTGERCQTSNMWEYSFWITMVDHQLENIMVIF